MRKNIFIVLVIFIFGIICYLFLHDGNKIPNGKYLIKSNEKFPNAYAMVSGKTIQFFNIDFNSMFREQQLSSILTAQEERGFLNTGYTKDELIELSDINHLVVDQVYDFSKLRVIPDDTDKNSFFYHLAIEGDYFGLWIKYNTVDKVLCVPGKTAEDPELIFER